MRIFLLNQFFWPDSAPTSQLLTDLAREFARNGHEVHAICADSGYAPDRADNAPPVQIHRVRSLPFVRGRLGRILSYASYYVGAVVRSLRLPRPDLVITLTTPPLLSLVGNAVMILRGARHYIWEMDIYPDVAVDLGYFKPDSLLTRIVGWLADGSRHLADGVIALGECMKQRLIGHGIAPGQIAVADNWADSHAITVLPRQDADARLVVLYSGNLGLAHDIDTISAAMLSLREDPRFHFLFVGSGGRREELARFAAAHHLQAIEFRPYAPRESLSQGLAAGDIGLVMQRDICCGSVVPSKMYALLAAGRPVLFIGPADATPARIIHRFKCGWHVACGDVASLVALLHLLADHPEVVRSAGQRARQTLVENFDLPLGVARIAAIVGATPQPPHLTSDVDSVGELGERLHARS